MPNWCSNDLTFVGTPEQIEEVRKVIGEDLDITNFHPMPEVLVGTTEGSDGNGKIVNKDAQEQTGYNSWYDWSIANWGVKWPPSDVEETDGFDEMPWADVSEEYLCLRFDTPWGPPSKLIDAIASQVGVDIHLRYYECGMGYQGILVYNRDGACEIDETMGYIGNRGG